MSLKIGTPFIFNRLFRLSVLYRRSRKTKNVFQKNDFVAFNIMFAQFFLDRNVYFDICRETAKYEWRFPGLDKAREKINFVQNTQVVKKNFYGFYARFYLEIM